MFVMCRQYLSAIHPDAKLRYGTGLLAVEDKKDLLPLKHYHGTQIVAPDLFIRLLKRGG